MALDVTHHPELVDAMLGRLRGKPAQDDATAPRSGRRGTHRASPARRTRPRRRKSSARPRAIAAPRLRVAETPAPRPSATDRSWDGEAIASTSRLSSSGTSASKLTIHSTSLALRAASRRAVRQAGRVSRPTDGTIRRPERGAALRRRTSERGTQRDDCPSRCLQRAGHLYRTEHVAAEFGPQDLF